MSRRIGQQAFARRAPGQRLRRLSVRLPNSPLSYDGILIKIHWCVRVRVFLPGGKEWLSEAAFRLGDVARAQEAPP